MQKANSVLLSITCLITAAGTQEDIISKPTEIFLPELYASEKNDGIAKVKACGHYTVIRSKSKKVSDLLRHYMTLGSNNRQKEQKVNTSVRARRQVVRRNIHISQLYSVQRLRRINLPIRTRMDSYQRCNRITHNEDRKKLRFKSYTNQNSLISSLAKRKYGDSILIGKRSIRVWIWAKRAKQLQLWIITEIFPTSKKYLSEPRTCFVSKP